MKKILSIIAAFALLTGCDDGDMTYKKFDFTTATATPCTLATDATTVKYYKLTGTEALILEVSATAFKNQSTIDPETHLNVPYEIPITTSGANTLTYKNYSSAAIASGSVCNIYDDTETNAETWHGEGTLSVITVEDRETTTGKLKGYIHAVTIQNISFYKGDETIIINNNLFGNISRPLGFTFDFSGETETDPPAVDTCEDTNLVYTLKGAEVLTIKLNDFANDFPDDAVKEIDLENNDLDVLLFNVYNGNLTKNVICPVNGVPPITPTIKQQWKASKGTIRIKPREEANIFVHDIYITDDTEFTNTSTGEVFKIKDRGTIDTTENAYFFGTL
jgi:hypothetical protein